MIIKIILSIIILSFGAIPILVSIRVYRIIDNDTGTINKFRKRLMFDIKKENTFSVSAYLDRIEKAWLEILQEREKEPKAEFVLWLGLDGLRLNDDGTSEWISRREPKPWNTGVFSQPLNMQNAVHYGRIAGVGTGGTGISWTIPYDSSQSTRANIEKMMMQRSALQTQSTIDSLNMQMIDLQAQEKHEHLMQMMQGCCCEKKSMKEPVFLHGLDMATIRRMTIDGSLWDAEKRRDFL